MGVRLGWGGGVSLFVCLQVSRALPTHPPNHTTPHPTKPHPQVRDGRMDKFYWAPDFNDKVIRDLLCTRTDPALHVAALHTCMLPIETHHSLLHHLTTNKRRPTNPPATRQVEIVLQMYKDDGIQRADVEKLLSRFSNQGLDFFGHLRSSTYDGQIRDWIEEITGTCALMYCVRCAALCHGVGWGRLGLLGWGGETDRCAISKPASPSQSLIPPQPLNPSTPPTQPPQCPPQSPPKHTSPHRAQAAASTTTRQTSRTSTGA